MLRDIGPFKTEYSSDLDDLATDFYALCLDNSSQYDRITGFFSSSIFLLLHDSLAEFVLQNDGVIRFICSPRLSQADADGILYGYSARDTATLAETLTKELEEMLESDQFESGARLLASLIAARRLEVRFAIVNVSAGVPTKRMFHDKVGLFVDAVGDSVGFRGSANETFLGVSPLGNIESIDVWPSWDGGRDGERVANAAARFDDLWEGRQPGVRVLALPDEFRSVLEIASEGLDLEAAIKATRKGSSKRRVPPPPPDIGDVSLRPHQRSAISAWEANNHRGVFAHATGSGKTITGLYAAKLALDEGLVPIVFVPSKLLLEQWATQSSTLLGARVLRVGGGNTAWSAVGTLRATVESLESGQRYVIVALLNTATSDEFRTRIAPILSKLFPIFDEVHRVGSPLGRQLLDWFQTEWRLGLSATPERANDPEGTAAITSYFGGIVSRYSIKDALDDGVLSPYRYEPNWVGLDDQEEVNWEQLTREIQRLFVLSKAKGASEQSRQRLQMKLIARARIAKNAARKVPMAVEIVLRNYSPGSGQKWLIYCDNQSQLRDVRASLSHNGIASWEYHSEMAGDAETTLSLFDVNGGIVVAIKCLDEGVDIPSATHALILASSRNPREFIQRRGRILRRSPAKTVAMLMDVLVLPDEVDHGDPTWGLVVGELARARQFAEWAVNGDAVSVIEDKWLSMGLPLDEFDQLMNDGIEGDEDGDE